ncbi:MAG: oligosaccharide flippase family protein [Deltaproteobacteria bacterium]|jgi:O-antigen/teichoic acid export membrane protein|nr:oligosaccharide flippase family protein [Deltaproteobacteria bacterium]
MFNKIKKLGGESVIYGLGDALYKTVTFFLLPIYLKYLTPSDYGVLESALVTRSLAILLLSLGVSSAFFRYYFKAGSEHEKKLIFSTSFLGFIVLQIPLPLCFIFFNKWISNLILSSPEYGIYFAIVAVNIFLIGFRMVPLQLYRAKGQALRFSIIMLTVATSTMIFNIVFVAFIHLGVMGVLLGNLCGGLTGILLVMPTVMKNFVFRFDFNVAKKLFKYGVPLGMSQLPMALVLMSDRYFLAHLTDLATLGIYSVGYKFGAIVRIGVIVPILRAWNPFLFEYGDGKDAPQLFSKVIYIYFLLCMTVTVIVTLYASPIINIMGKSQYSSAHKIVPFICTGMVLMGLARMLRAGILLSGKTYLVAIIMIFTLLINFAGNMSLIPALGMHGAAYSFLLAMTFNMVLSYFVGRKELLIPLELQRMIKLALCSISVIGIAYFIPTLNILKDLTSRTFFFGLYVVLIFITKCISESEIKTLKNKIFGRKSLAFPKL